MMQINRPTLLLDQKKCIRNIEKMVIKSKKHKLILRPHFKTHRSKYISNLFKEYGIDKCTVSNVEMAEYFAKSGFNDITIAFPLNILQISLVEKLARKINLNILIDNIDTFEILEKKINLPLNSYLEIDTGADRTGFHYSKIDVIKQICTRLYNSKKLILKGLLTHAGNTYLCRSKDMIDKVHYESISRLIKIKFELKLDESIILSIGDTPSCSISEQFEGIDEIRPGNFVFYDVMQLQIGSCSIDDIAMCLACPIVSIDKKKEKVVIWGGSAHLSKEFIEFNGAKVYGLVVKLNPKGWELIENAYVFSISQEHGCLYIPENSLKQFSIGNILGILPIHSCSTVGLMRQYYILGSENNIPIFPDNY